MPGRPARGKAPELLVGEYMLEAILADDRVRTAQCLTKSQGPEVWDRMPAELRGAAPVHLAAYFGSWNSFQSFLDVGDGLGGTDAQGRGLAHFICAGGNINIMNAVRHMNLNWGLEDYAGRSPAVHAAAHGHDEALMKLWIQGYLGRNRGQGWRQPLVVGSPAGDPNILMAAAKGGHARALSVLLSQVGVPLYNGKAGPGHENSSALHAACAGGHRGAVRVLLDAGALQFGLHRIYVWHGGPWEALATPLGEAALMGAFRCCEDLIETQCELGAQLNPVLLAACAGHWDVVRLLLNRWPQLRTPEVRYVAYASGHPEVAGDLRGFEWTRFTVGALVHQPVSAIKKLCKVFNIRGVEVEWFGPRGGAHAWAGVREMLARGANDRKLLGAVCAKYHTVALAMPLLKDEEFWNLLRWSGLKPCHADQHKPYRTKAIGRFWERLGPIP